MKIGSEIAAGAAGAVIGTAADVTSGFFNSAMAEKAAAAQYERQLDFWDKQNQYNTPVEQRKRLEAAGLNPAAVMSEGVSNQADGLSNVPGNEYAKQGVIRQHQLGMIADNMVKFAQAANLNANTEKQGAETNLISSQADYQELRNNIERQVQEVKNELNRPVEVDAIIADFNKRQNEADISDFMRQMTRIERDKVKYLYDNMYHELERQAKENEVKISDEELKRLSAVSTFAFTKELGEAFGSFAPAAEVLLEIFKIWMSTKK